MTEIQPDTSKYTDLPNKLRAFAEILATGQKIQCNTKTAPNDMGWGDTNTKLSEKLEFLLSGVDYRAKPKPRELWAVYEANGESLTTCSGKSAANEIARTNGRTVVRFVEQPE